MQIKTILTALAGAAVLLGVSWLLSTVVSQEDLERLLERCGAWAPAAYMGLFTLLPAFFFPVAVLALVGGLLFGLWYGSLYTFLGAMCNCALMFLLARSVGRGRVERLIQTRLSPVWQDRLAQIGGRKGFLLLVVLRLIPAVPYNLINYAFGLSGMPLGTYMAASAIGIIPGTLAFINIGDKAMDAGSPGFWIAIGLLVLLLVVTTLLGKKLFPGPGKKEKGA